MDNSPIPGTSRRDFLQSTAGFALAACGVSVWRGLPEVSRMTTRSSWAMGTYLRASATADGAVFKSVFASLAGVDERFTIHRPSYLRRLNESPQSWQALDSDLGKMLRAARSVAEASEGALDPTLLPVLRRLGFAPGDDGPAAEHVAERTGWNLVECRDHQIRLSAGCELDLGGIAKGYAVDQGIDVFRASGVVGGLLEAGGDLYALGRPQPDRLWRVGIRDPYYPDSIYATVDVSNEAVATSGTYEQRRGRGDRSWSHLVDPRTLTPVDHIVSVTVVAQDALTADMLATASAILAPEASTDLIKKWPGAEAAWVYADRSQAVTDGLRSRFTLL